MKSELEVLKSTIQFFENALNPFSKEETQAKNHKGEYQYIPLEASTFIKDVQTVKTILDYQNGYEGYIHDENRKGKPIHFIDVGCGFGTKLVMACQILQSYNREVKITGLEITPQYVEIAKKLLSVSDNQYYGRYDTRGLDKINVIQGDGRTHNYRPYNVIYFYCPMCSPDLQKVLEERIIKTAKVGTFVIAHNSQGISSWQNKANGWHHACDHIYQKVGKVRGSN